MAEGEDGGLGFDLDAAVGEVGSGLGLGTPEREEPETPEQTETPEAPESQQLNGEKPVAQQPTVRTPPKSWATEQHERWAKIDPDTQQYIELREKQFADGIHQYRTDADYGKTLRSALAPYEQVIKAAGLEAPQAVTYLMNAHYRLTQGTPEQRMAAYQKLGADLGLAKVAPGQELPPELKQLTERLTGIESALTERQQAEYQQTLTRVSQEVEQFASDDKHPYFDECADDIALYIKAGATLQDAYDKAVWANPVTRAKETARVKTETEQALRGQAEKDIAQARKAAGGNVRPAETPKAPTEPKGSMDDTMRDTLKKIRARAH